MIEEMTSGASPDIEDESVPYSPDEIAREDAGALAEGETLTQDGDDAPDTQTPSYEEMERADMEELKRDFPALSSITSLGELENPARYGELRELGLSAREAYLATTTPKVQRALPYDNRSHLRSAIPRAHGGTGEQISAAEMREARELFSELSDSEIVKLYKKVNS